MCMLYMFAHNQLGTDSIAASDMDKTMRYVMRAMPVLMVPIVAKFPAVSTGCIFHTYYNRFVNHWLKF